jgi:hypothetical protein
MPEKIRPISPVKKAAQHRRTRDNKIRRLTKMLMQNPMNKFVKERLEYWLSNSR